VHEIREWSGIEHVGTAATQRRWWRKLSAVGTLAMSECQYVLQASRLMGSSTCVQLVSMAWTAMSNSVAWIRAHTTGRVSARTAGFDATARAGTPAPSATIILLVSTAPSVRSTFDIVAL
jgi:hypothetical protein